MQHATNSPVSSLLSLPESQREKVLLKLTDDECKLLLYDWASWARPKQLPPPGPWLIWLILAGRGWGKTRVGSEWVRSLVENKRAGRIALVAPTSADTRDVIVEGESGILATAAPWCKPVYKPSQRRLDWPNGAQAHLYSAEEPERLRGPQHDAAWCDELAAWQYPTETWDMLQFGLRLGKNPPCAITTTPKPITLVRELVRRSRNPEEQIVITSGSTYENKRNLARSFFNQIAQYEGTKLGRQEIHAEVIDPEEGGIIKRSWFKLWPNGKEFPNFKYIVQSYDTAFTEKTTNDPTACSVWGVWKPEDQPFQVMLIDAWQDHLEYPELRKRAKEEYGYVYGNPGKQPDIVLIEDKGSGVTLRQDLVRAGVPARPYNPGREDKVARLHNISHIPCAGRVWLPESNKEPGKFRTWAEEFVNAVCTIPNNDGDDHYGDTFSQAMARLRDEGWLSIDPPKHVDDLINEEDYQGKKVNPYAL